MSAAAPTLELAPYVAGALGAGGLGVWISGKRELIKRWATWAVTAPVVGISLMLRPAGAVALAAGLGVVGAYEYARLVGLRRADRCLLQVAALGLPLLAWLQPSWLVRAALCAPLVAALPVLLSGDTEGGGRRAAYTSFGALWLAALSGLVLLGGQACALCLAVSVADVGAWCFGRALRGPKLSPLSPGKTWSGLIGGAVTAGLVLAALGAATPALLVAACLGGPAGDLLESALKREAGCKDAGRWLPGFGGLLDRVDALLVALALAVVLS